QPSGWQIRPRRVIAAYNNGLATLVGYSDAVKASGERRNIAIEGGSRAGLSGHSTPGDRKTRLARWYAGAGACRPCGWISLGDGWVKAQPRCSNENPPYQTGRLHYSLLCRRKDLPSQLLAVLAKTYSTFPASDYIFQCL